VSAENLIIVCDRHKQRWRYSTVADVSGDVDMLV
jgi:hypothetical protein